MTASELLSPLNCYPRRGYNRGMAVKSKFLSVILCSWLLGAVLEFAGERVALWPQGKIPDFQTSQIAATTQEVKAPGFKAADHAMPYLDWYEAPAEKNGGCMLLISGGGYQSCCDGVWIDRVAKKLSELGFVCASLTYRTPRPQGLPIYHSAWEDGQLAVRLVRNDSVVVRHLIYTGEVTCE